MLFLVLVSLIVFAAAVLVLACSLLPFLELF